LFEFGVGNGFVRRIIDSIAEEAVEVFDGAAVLAVGLRLVAEEEGEGFAIAGHEVEAFGEGVGVALAVGDGEVAGTVVLAAEGGSGDEVLPGVERGDEGSGFEAVSAEDGQLGEGDSLDGEMLLGVPGAVSGDGVGDQVGEGVAVLAGSDGEGGGGEAVLA
jgi:hypothetical protein